MKDSAPIVLADSSPALGVGGTVKRIQLIPRQADRRQSAPQAVLLALVAAGMLWGNVLVFWFLDFPVTLTVLLTTSLFILGIGNWIGPTHKTNKLLWPALTLLLYEFIIHGVLGGSFSDSQWLRSFALLAMCTGLLIVSSRFQISERQLPTLATWMSLAAYAFGGLGIVQFITSNAFGYLWSPLPPEFEVGQSVAAVDAARFGGLFRSRGISTEYSYYGIGMVMLSALCLTLLTMAPPNGRTRSFRIGALMVAIGGVFASASFAALGVLAAILLIYVATNRGYILKHKRSMLATAILIIAAVVLLRPFLQDRFLSVLENSEDHSVNYRLRSTIELVSYPADDILSALLGTGVGLDAMNPRVLRTFEELFGTSYLNWAMAGRSNIVLVSGWAYVVITMGWVALALNGWLLVTVFRGPSRLSFPALFLFALSIGYLLAVGSYLSPEWWAWLVLVSVLKRVHTQ